MGVFANITIETQKITIGIRDLVGKIIGVVVVFMYMMQGSVITMQSTWAAPPGQMIRTMGNCFDPNTLVKRKDGSIVTMKELEPNDVLENGSIVKMVMKIANDPTETFYAFSNGINNSFIYVTGTHYIRYNNRFIQVKDHPDALKLGKDFKTDFLSCLVTSDHSIVLGDRHFYDWEDFRLQH
jgi:hypothetical protein